jgi:nucleoside-triphosphatase THEP1
MQQNMFILCDEVQSGKTTLLQQFCKKYSQTAGILSPIVNGQRVFYNIGTKEFFDMEAKGDEAHLAIGKYLFSAEAFTKASGLLLAASKQNTHEYLIIDEVGPLEINRREGFYHALTQIVQEQSFNKLILVVRPSLLSGLTVLPGLQTALQLSRASYKDYFSL